MILVIDDDPEFQEKAQIALAAIHAHGILFADSGKRALELLEKFGDEIAVALTDLNLPDTNGFDLISQISRKYGKLRVVAVSAYGHAALDSAKLMGASAVLVKPICKDEWEEIVDRVRAARAASS
jgi:CheY-like chemotaxis protein